MLPFVLILLAFAADRLSKWWAADFLAQNGATQLHPLLTIVPTYNRGIAFGMFQGIGPIVGWLSLFIIAALGIYLVRIPKHMWVLRIGMALIIGGALGNLVDRVTMGRVLDFIQTPIRPGVFNVADVMIYLGVIISLGGLLLQRSEPEVSRQRLEIEEGPADL
jgi:signal peptidase II